MPQYFKEQGYPTAELVK